MPKKEKMWPYGLGLSGVVLVAGGLAWETWWVYQPAVTVVLVVGVAACMSGLAAIYWDRERVRRFELEELRSEVATLRSRQEGV